MTPSYIAKLEETIKRIIAELDAALERAVLAEKKNQLLEEENRSLRVRLLLYEIPILLLLNNFFQHPRNQKNPKNPRNEVLL